MNSYTLSQLIVLGIMSVVLGNCNSPSAPKQDKKEDAVKIPGPEGYDMGNPQVYPMPQELKEISGIAFPNGRSDTLYSIQDEDGWLFYSPLGSKDMNRVKFGKRGDYEDIAISKGEVFLLRSDGVVMYFPLADAMNGTIGQVKQSGEIIPKGEYEAMAIDGQGNIIVVCKDCEHDSKREVSAYVIGKDEQGAFVPSRTLTLDAGRLKAEGKKKHERFMPSCLALHPVSHEWYVVSSVSRELLVFDETWHAKAAYALDATRFPQPEGITFDAQGNLFISNEGGDLGSANILKFANQLTAQE